MLLAINEESIYGYILEQINLLIVCRYAIRRLSENREPTAEKPFRRFFPLIFVKYTHHV